MLCADVFSFFFFQAEDGIRDYKVTGVQTCALPICTKCVNGPLPIAGVQTRQRDCSSNRRIPCHRPQICTVPQAWLRSFPPPCAGSWLALAVANGRGGGFPPGREAPEQCGWLPPPGGG